MEPMIITQDTDADALAGKTIESDRWGHVEIIAAGHLDTGVMFSGRVDGAYSIAVLPYGDEIREV